MQDGKEDEEEEVKIVEVRMNNDRKDGRTEGREERNGRRVGNGMVKDESVVEDMYGIVQIEIGIGRTRSAYVYEGVDRCGDADMEGKNDEELTENLTQNDVEKDVMVLLYQKKELISTAYRKSQMKTQ